MIGIPVASASITDLERRYVLEALDSGFVSGAGPFVQRFERAFAERIQTQHAVACCNGTVALHLALVALGCRPGNEVIVPDLTYVATANAVSYCGATPVFADVLRDTWCISPESVRSLITPRTVGIIPVHLYGQPADMHEICAIADAHGLFVIEDASEAHGAHLNQRPVGSYGDASTFSFYGNKLLTTGEGGIVCTSDPDLEAKLRSYRGHCVDAQRTYWFTDVGYNYRMSALCAAFGLAQTERLEQILSVRRQNDAWYRSALASLPLKLPATREWADDVCWLFSVVFEEPEDRARAVAALREAEIDSRPFFPSLSTLPFHEAAAAGRPPPSTSRWLADRGMNLPTGEHVTAQIVDAVASALSEAL